MRASKSANEQVVALEQIVSDLLFDKGELTRIAQAYQHELVAQQLTPGDVQYITINATPQEGRYRFTPDGLPGCGRWALQYEREPS